MLNSWGFSGMGFGAAGVLGAKLAAPERPCVAVTGDGCFAMVPHVLCTAVEYAIPVVWVVWNNFSFASIRDIQLGMFNQRELGTAFHEGANKTPYNPDFAAWARAAGAEGVTVTKSQDFAGDRRVAVAADALQRTGVWRAVCARGCAGGVRLLLEHDLVRKPVPTFRHHARALGRADTAWCQRRRCGQSSGIVSLIQPAKSTAIIVVISAIV